MNPAERLGDFRRLAAGQVFSLGTWDCAMFCADWVRLVRGVDPAAGWRGTYVSELGMVRLLKRRGGMVAHFDACLAVCGIGRTSEPRSGDIAIVETPQGLTGGVLAGATIMLASAGRGIIDRHLKLAPIVAAWRI